MRAGSVVYEILRWIWALGAPVTTKPGASRQDRISVGSWLVVFGLGVSLVIRIPPIEFVFRALGSPIGIVINTSTLAAAFLVLLTASATESVIQTHPRFRGMAGWDRIRFSWQFWGLPSALTVIAALLLPLSKSVLVQTGALLAVGGLFPLSLYLLYATVEPGRPGFRRARILLNVLAYACAFLLLLLVYQTRTRSLLSGSLVAATAMLLAIELLRGASERVSQVMLYVLIIGLVLGQVTWALNYWILSGVTGGLLLMLIFYLMVSIAQHGLQNRLDRRVMAEFGVFAVLALVLIAVVGPGYSL